MSKSEQIRQRLLKRAREGKTAIGDLSGIREFLEAVVEEALKKKAKQEKVQAKH